MMNRPQWIQEWLSSVRERSGFQTKMVSLSPSSTWKLTDGIIRHKTGRFFNIVGIRWKNPEGKYIVQPIIEQREIGTLGCLLRGSKEKQELLVHAKIEPGNVGVVQLAPTCQATASNIARVHGGEAPPYCEWFVPGEAHILGDSNQSEQGTRFLDKLNRNALASTTKPVSAIATHRWVPVDEVLELLKLDYLFNTDARSVLVCGPWKALVDRAPFTRYRTPFGADLAQSAIHDGKHKSITAIRRELEALRNKISPPEIIPLEELDGWNITDEGVLPAEGQSFAIRYIEVTAKGREVQFWDQPIVDSVGEGYNELVCGRIDGILHFLFRPQIEPGLYNLVELGPTVIVEPGEELPEDTATSQSSKEVVMECWQSDEGGRFYQDSTLYRIVDVGEAYDVPVDWYWLTLKQIQLLLQEQGWLTNEARSSLSLVISWL